MKTYLQLAVMFVAALVTGCATVGGPSVSTHSAPVTLQPGESITITAAAGSTPPANVVCPDGSTHPPGYVCPTTPPPVTGACPGFARTLDIKIDWANPQRMLTANYGGMNAETIAVVSFTTGSGPSQSNNLPRIAGAEYGGGAANRIVALSAERCSFVPVNGLVSSQTSSAPTIPFNLVTPDPYGGYYPVLQAHTTYFLNVKNAPNSGCTTSCDMFFDLSKNGTP